MRDDHAGPFRIDDQLEIEVRGDTCRLHGRVGVTFALSGARFVWTERDGLGVFHGELTITLGEEPAAPTLSLSMSSDAARRLRFYLERQSATPTVH